MKHIRLFLLLALLATVGMVWAQDQAFDFDGETCITIGNMTSDVTTSFTVEAWFRTNDITVSQTGEPGDLTATGVVQFGRTIFGSSAATEKPMWVSILGNSVLVRTFGANDPQITYVIPGFNTTTWYHIAVSAARSGTVTLYINGVSVASAPAGTLYSWNNQLTLGDLRDGRGLTFWGAIDDVRVWNDIRTGAEISDNYDKTLNGDEPGLTGYWMLDGNTLDTTANNYDGTVSGTTTFVEGIVTLPIELSSFTAVPNAQYFVELHWITQSETNVAGFRVYRSETPYLENAVMFNTFVPAHNTSSTQVYTYVDEEIFASGTYYYWLENVDMTGSTQFHGPVIATVTYGEPSTPPAIPATANGIQKIFPNPFNPTTS
ncbi:MAG: LamG domain-containing protein, partial [Candidatus Cloacimonadota bacterium]